MGQLGKKVAKDYVDFECLRQLFLSLGRDDGRWLDPPRKLAPSPPQPSGAKIGLTELGKEYESFVYKVLSRNPSARFQLSTSLENLNPVAPSYLDAAQLEGLHAELAASPGAELYLLEYAWPTADSFARRLLSWGEGELPLTQPPGTLRPDIHVIGNAVDVAHDGPILEVLPDGTCAEVPRAQLSSRFGINVLDIKHTSEVSVSKSHFIELLYYAIALRHHLDAIGLSGRFFVRADHNGIFPKRTYAELSALMSAGPREHVVPLSWRDTAHVFHSVTEAIHALQHWGLPRPIESVPVRIQPACGRCSFLNDCIRSHKHTPDDPGSWDLALIPYLSPSTAAQLRERGFRTVADVAEAITDVEPGLTPQPIYAELPLLAVKARALQLDQRLPASPEHAGGERQFNIHIPRYSDINLYFDVESDPTNEVIFALGLYLDIAVHSRAPFHPVHERWWEFWRGRLRAGRFSRRDASRLDGLLDPTHLERTLELSPAARAKAYNAFFRALSRLDAAAGGELTVAFPGEPLGKTTASWLAVSYQYTYVNAGTGSARGYHDDERVVATRLVELLYDILTVARVFELFVRVGRAGQGGDAYSIGPNTAGFYYSGEQLQHVQDLLERHTPALLDDADQHRRLVSLIHWLSPSESSVAHPLQHMKIFDLRAFVEGSVGLPEIINVTWHGVHHHVKDLPPGTHPRRFWAPHFNYMDFTVWHEYIEERDSNAQTELRERIQFELLKKLWALRDILNGFRKMAGGLISESRARPIRSEHLKEPSLPTDTHPIARAWYLFTQLSAARQHLEAEHFRTTFPSYSVAKLAAARVSHLAADATPPATAAFTFQLQGLSTNMKVKEGDHVLLLPESRRDATGYELDAYRVILDRLEWSADEDAYYVEASTAANSHGRLTEAELAEPRWYLYTNASDPWSRKLSKLIGRRRMGTSWLGARAALLLGVGAPRALPEPDSFTVGLPELYLYAPHWLPRRDFDPAAPLLTAASPTPDASQAEAIHFALSSSLACVQGPPGTGKSQTIAALIDELLCRRPDGPLRVLVTAFSYAALEVVLDKVRRGRDVNGQPTQAAQTQLVWARSSSREPIPDAPPLAHVTDWDIGGGLNFDGVTVDRRRKEHRGKTLTDILEPRFILFANAHSLYKLPDTRKKIIAADFGFDLIIADEASQLPADYLLAALGLLPRAEATVEIPPEHAGQLEWPCASRDILGAMRLREPLDFDACARVVIVGDHNQLPPVQPVKPPRKLEVVLGSAFHYYVEGFGVEHHQLQTNYRSHPTIVEYTRRLGIYRRGLIADRAQHPHPALPAPTADSPAWVRDLLDPTRVVSALIHGSQHETAVSPLEAHLTATLTVAFFHQLGVDSAEAERTFWVDHLGIVAPHNAQGRLITRAIYDALMATDHQSFLPEEELMHHLRNTIYSVEKFQGSDRTFIIGSLGISSRDQLAAEEEFIYDLNRFNVLTSRAKQKMLLICSRDFLDYIPRDRDVMASAARIRDFAFGFCDQEQELKVTDADGDVREVLWRWRGGVAPVSGSWVRCV